MTVTSTRETPERNRELVRRAAQVLAEAEGEVVATAATATRAGGMSAFVIPTVAVAFAGVVIAYARPAETPPRSVPFSKESIISQEMVGTRTGVEAFTPAAAPRQEPTVATAPESPAQEFAGLSPTTEPPRDPAPPRPASAAKEARATAPPEACASCAQKDAAAAKEEQEIVFDASRDGEIVGEEGSPPRSGGVLNVGTRIPFTLTHPVLTGSAAAPVTAQVTADLAAGEGVVIPRGATLVGTAFAIEGDERAQIVLSAAVVSGRTIALRAVVLGPDNSMGLRGKVLRKGSRTKGGVGRTIRAIGSAASFGLIPGSTGGLVGAATSELLRDTGDALAGLGQSWTVSDKVIRIEAGAAGVAYVQADVVLQ